MFAALSAEDIPKLRSLIAPDFYAFEAGGRITGDALIDLMKKARAAGKAYVWTVTNLKFTSMEAWPGSRISIEGPSRTHPRTKNVSWLESSYSPEGRGAIGASSSFIALACHEIASKRAQRPTQARQRPRTVLMPRFESMRTSFLARGR